MAIQLIRLTERLKFLQKLLTTEGIDEKLPHADRVRLTEEAEELYQEEASLRKAGYVSRH